MIRRNVVQCADGAKEAVVAAVSLFSQLLFSLDCRKNHFRGMYVFLSLILLLLVHVEGCYIWGTDSGTCSTDTLDPLWRLANMPYCADAIQYPACIPTYQVLRSFNIIT